MTERAEEPQRTELPRIVLVSNEDVVELTGLNPEGNQLLGGLRTTLDLAINRRLIGTTPFDFAQTEVPSAPVWTSPERTLELAIAHYRANPYDPSRLAEFYAAHWSFRRTAMGLSQRDLVVSDCLYSEDDLRSWGATDFGLLVPQVVSTAPEGLILLGKADPTLDSRAFQEGTSVRNVDSKGKAVELDAWMRTEKGVDAPHTRTNQKQAEEIVEQSGRVGDTLNVYAVAGVVSHELFGYYLDQERTWTRVLSSRGGSRVVGASFGRGGRCSVGWRLFPGSVYDGLGVRSVEVAELKA